MTMKEFFRAYRDAQSIPSHCMGVIGHQVRIFGPGTIYCPITLVYKYKTDEFMKAEAVAGCASRLGLAPFVANQIVRAADSNPKDLTLALRRLRKLLTATPPALLS